MFRRGLIIPVLLGTLPVAAAAWVFSPTLFDRALEPQVNAQPQFQRSTVLSTPDLEALKPRDGTAKHPEFDVARISPDGWSVFAGTAPPNSTVTVTADGEPIGTAKADERGEWTLMSDHRFTSLDPVLGLSTHGEAVEPEPTDRRGAEPEAATAKLDPPARLMRDFEDLVASARRSEQFEGPRTAVRAPVPVPIQFVFRQAEFTEDGRRAVELLSEYVKLKRPESIMLTGHADERGSDAFNIELSRQRLEAVAEHLRRQGYQGGLVLIPKGSSEPYQGVDRTTLDRHTLWQLDRRVELVLGAEVQPHRSVQGGGSSVPQ